MSIRSSAIGDGAVAPPGTRTRPGALVGGFGRLVARLLSRLLRLWRGGVYIHERLLEAQCPWELEGGLRWQRDRGGWRLVGSTLPLETGAAPGSEPA